MTGIYMLKDGDEVVYVGKSKDIDKRILQHSQSEKVFDSHACIECSIDLLESTEISYIRMLSPKYNRQHKLTQDNTVYIDSGLKMLQVDEETHDLVKVNAAKKKMSIKAYVKMIVEKDSK